ncbi:MAG: hypothetical protein KAU83_08290, partial [Bacteroidales bacterium]|nr:hypothetical protein [Bacteroidales bacterium]
FINHLSSMLLAPIGHNHNPAREVWVLHFVHEITSLISPNVHISKHPAPLSQKAFFQINILD